MNQNRISLLTAAKFLLHLALFLSLIQQMPIIFENYYSIIRILLYFLLVFSIIFTLLHKRRIPSSPLFFIFLCVLIYSLFLDTYLFIVGGKVSLFQLLMIPFAIILISPYLYSNANKLASLLLVYSLLSVVVMLTVVLYYNKGFSISSTYTIAGKNYKGVLLSNSILILIILFSNIKKRFVKFIMFGFPFFGLFLLLVIRNRSSLLGLTLLLILFLFYSLFFSKNHKIRKSIMIGFGIALLTFLFIPKISTFFFDSFFKNKNMDSLNSISAGRLFQYTETLLSIQSYPLFGVAHLNIAHDLNPHNYLLYNLYYYGFILSVPQLILYFSLYIYLFYLFINSKHDLFSRIIFAILFVNLTVSLLEYTYPYGPGTAQIIMWILIGWKIGNPEKNTNLSF